MLKPIIVFIVGLSLAFAGFNGKANSSTNGGVESVSNAGAAKSIENEPGEVQSTSNSDEQLSPFVRRIFQDKSGNLWFGTNGDGVIRYDGNALKYFSINEGFGGVAVRGIVGDKEGNVWFGTEGGLTKYDGKSFTNFTEKDGLVNNDVWSIVIDSKGIIWIGTLQGVSRFDGKVFTPFELPEGKPDPTRGVTSAKIVHSIMEDSTGKMWFGTNGGAYIYEPSASLRPGGKNLSKLSEKDGLPDNNVNCILEDKEGNFWFATHHKGICRWDGKSFTHFTSKDGVKGTEAWDLYEDKAGNVWFPIENSGVYRYDGKSFTNFQKEQGLTTNAIQCTFEDKEGRLWLGGWKGLFRYDPSASLRPGGKSIFSVGKNGPWQEQNKTDLPKETESQPKSNRSDVDSYFVESEAIATSHGPRSITRNIMQDRKGNIWLATWNGIVRYDPASGGFTNFTNREGLRRYRAFCILEDKTGNIWFGTVGAGAYRYDGKSFTNFTIKDGLANDIVGCIYEDKTGNIWFGTNGGASRYDGKSFRNFTTKEGLTNNDINCIIEDKTGKFWFATRGDACSYDGKTFTKFTNKEGVPFKNVRSIIEDKKGNLWTSSAANGRASNWVLSRYDEKSLLDENATATQIRKEEGMFFGILEDSNGDIWFGSLNGACRYDGKSFNYFKDAGVKGIEHKKDTEELSESGIAPAAIRFDAVLHIFEDNSGNFWFGNSNKGVCRFDGKPLEPKRFEMDCVTSKLKEASRRAAKSQSSIEVRRDDCL